MLLHFQKYLRQKLWLKIDSPVCLLILSVCLFCSITGCGQMTPYQQSLNKYGVRVGVVEPTAADVASQIVQAIDQHDVSTLYRLSDAHLFQRNATICALMQRWPKQMLKRPESSSGVGPYPHMNYHERHYVGKHIYIPIRMNYQHDAFYAMLKLRYTEHGWRVVSLEELVHPTERTTFANIPTSSAQTCTLPQYQKPA